MDEGGRHRIGDRDEAEQIGVPLSGSVVREVQYRHVASELWYRCNAALWDEARALSGAEFVVSTTSPASREVVEVGIRVAPDRGVVYVFPIPLPGSRLGHPWSDAVGGDLREWARQVVAWIQESVVARFPGWVVFDDGRPYRRVFIGSEGLLSR